MGNEIHARMQGSRESAHRAVGRGKSFTELDVRMERSPLLLCKNCFGLGERMVQSPSVEWRDTKQIPINNGLWSLAGEAAAGGEIHNTAST